MAAAKKKKTAKRTTKARSSSSRTKASQKSGLQLPKKIALSGGGYCLYAPRFPRFLTEPGFADEANIASEIVPSVFFLSFLANGTPFQTSCVGFEMEDGKAVLTHQGSNGIKIVERRYLTTDDRFVSDL
ncbi:MAG: hypothetical protein KAI24_04770, partial [Planctomycetes bacterium]|nr:hypothetical protein [Planctomycetota bacterium]